MQWWGYSAVVVMVGVCIIIWYSPVRIVGMMSKSAAEDQMSLSIRLLFGLVRYEMNMPFKRVLHLFNPSVHIEVEPDSYKVLSDRIRRMLPYRDLLIRWLPRFLSHLRYNQFKWSTYIGVGEAPETAVITGLAWAIKSMLVRLFSSRVDPSSAIPDLNVIPQFNQFHFSTYFHIRLRIRLGHALMDLVILLFRLKRMQAAKPKMVS